MGSDACLVCDPGGALGGDPVGSCTVCRRRICGAHLITSAGIVDYANPARAFIVEPRLMANYANGLRQPGFLEESLKYARGWAQGEMRCVECRQASAMDATADDRAALREEVDRHHRAVESLVHSERPEELTAAFEQLTSDAGIGADVCFRAWRLLTSAPGFLPAKFEAQQLGTRRRFFSREVERRGEAEPVWAAVFERRVDDGYGNYRAVESAHFISASGEALGLRVLNDLEAPWDGAFVFREGSDPQVQSSTRMIHKGMGTGTGRYWRLTNSYGKVVSRGVASFETVRQAVIRRDVELSRWSPRWRAAGGPRPRNWSN